MGKKVISLLIFTALLVMLVSGCTENGGNTMSDTVTQKETDKMSEAISTDGLPLAETENTQKDSGGLIERSFISAGNTERIMRAIEKAKNGEDVTIAYLGGSITQGMGASDDTNCYAYKSYEMFADKYMAGNNDKLHYVNAGIAGTPSALGIVRSQKDIISFSPDIVFVEFAVNDGCDDTSRKVYESLVKRLLESPSEPAVVLLFTVLESGYSAQEHMQAVGEHYNLGMISVKDAITSEIANGNMTFKGDYAADEAHPNDKGHQMICDFIEYFFGETENASREEYKIPSEELYSCEYADLYNITSESDRITSMGAFEIKKANCFTYENAFVHNAENGNEPLVFKAEFKKLMLCFRQNNSAGMGEAEIIVDGNSLEKITSFNENGWGNIETKIITAGNTPEEHTVEIRMTDDDSEKELWLLDIGCVK